jgi:hypothetical protein
VREGFALGLEGVPRGLFSEVHAWKHDSDDGQIESHKL